MECNFNSALDLYYLSCEGLQEISKADFIRVLSVFFNKSKSLVVKTWRPLYKIEKSIVILNQLKALLEYLKIDEQLFSITFACNVDKESELLKELLSELWFEYEEPYFYFFLNKEIINVESVLNDSNKRTDTLEANAGYLICHTGWEENVVSIGKSNGLLFPVELLDIKCEGCDC